MSYFRALPIDISTQAGREVVLHSGEHNNGNYCLSLEALCESGQLVRLQYTYQSFLHYWAFCICERWSRGRAPDCQSRGRWFNPTYRRFETLAISSPHICLCLSEETLKAGGPFYLVSMPGEVKNPTQGVNV